MAKAVLKWKDVTSYSRGASKDPQTYEAQAGDMRLYVTRNINYAPTDWLISLNGQRRVLRGDLAAEAAMLACEQWAEKAACEVLQALRGGK